MAKVAAWVKRFMVRHSERIPRQDWPPLSSAFWDGMASALVKCGAVEDVAEEASLAMVVEPPPFLDGHVPALVEHIGAIFRAQVATRPDAPTDRETAVRDSANCPFCGGQGLAPIWHPAPDYAKRIPETWSAYCDCAMGRWMHAKHREKFPGERGGMPTLEEVAAGRTPWLCDSLDMDQAIDDIERGRSDGKSTREMLEDLSKRFKK